MSSRYHAPLFGLTLILIGSAALAGGADAVRVGDPHARAVPPGQPNSAVFMSLHNGDGQDHALVGAKSPVAKVVELHTHVMEDGVARMRAVDRIDLPAGQTVELKPGGLHVMLIGLTHQLLPGETVAVSLTYADGSTAEIQAPVRSIQPIPAQHPRH